VTQGARRLTRIDQVFFTDSYAEMLDKRAVRISRYYLYYVKKSFVLNSEVVPILYNKYFLKCLVLRSRWAPRGIPGGFLSAVNVN
jgi:hypothetical protein